MRDLERKNELQWKNFKILQSEHNILKRTYFNLLDGHIEIIGGKNKTIKRLREKVKELKNKTILESYHQAVGRLGDVKND